MAAWISANWVTIVVLVVIALLVGLAVWSLLRDRKAKKAGGGCTGNCASCGYGGSCGTHE